MWKILILVSIAPFILGGLCANWFGLRLLLKQDDLGLTVEQVVQKLLGCLQRQDVVVEFVKSTFWGTHFDGAFKVPARLQHSKKVYHISKVLVSLGLYFLYKEHKSTINWRLKAVRMGYTLPIFVLLVVLFCCIVGKLPPLLALAVLSASLGGSTLMLWFSLPVEKEAAHLMVNRIEKLRLFPRLKEEEAIVNAIRATPWVSLIPGAVLKFIVKD